jgi:antitoxin (DNA-binding transcriptional repressor) of toxin-antitoxin stability system
MRPVPIGELKNRLSAYLQLVRAGEEIVVRDRLIPIAKIVPLDEASADLEDQTLVSAGLMKLPSKPFDPARFWAIGRGLRTPKLSRMALQQAMDEVREDLNVGIVGRKRRRSTLRARSGKHA